jgi:gluconate 2-dehydrogenase
MALPRVLVARAIFPQTLQRLRNHVNVEENAGDEVFTPAQLIERLQGMQGVLTTGSERIDAALLAACPELRVVANMAVGYNNIDIPACTAAGVLATNTPDVLTETTADFGFALMMATARRITESEHFLRRGDWNRWAYDMFTGSDVHGATLGILGMGRIGQAIARRGAHGFGMRVIYHNRSRLPPDTEAVLNASYVQKDDLLKQADHLLLVLPYSPESHHSIGAAELALMKPTATLTNIARGGIVDDAALASALQHRRIAAAGLDVFEGEPQVHPQLLALPNVVLTPHIASATVATRRAMAELAADNLIAALTGATPPTPINPQVLHAAVRPLIGAEKQSGPQGRSSCWIAVWASDLVDAVLDDFLGIADLLLNLAFALLGQPLGLLRVVAGDFAGLLLYLAGDVFDGTLDLVAVHGGAPSAGLWKPPLSARHLAMRAGHCRSNL